MPYVVVSNCVAVSCWLCVGDLGSPTTSSTQSKKSERRSWNSGNARAFNHAKMAVKRNNTKYDKDIAKFREVRLVYDSNNNHHWPPHVNTHNAEPHRGDGCGL